MKKLAIIGASYLQEPLVLRAKKLGLYTICFAWEDGAVCKHICHEFYPISITEKEEILAVCKKLEVDGITSIASDVAVPTINFVASNLNLIGNSIHSAQISTNKYSMRNAFLQNEVPIPSFMEVETEYNLEAINNLKFPIIVKPVDRSGSKGIIVLKSNEGLKNAIDTALSVSFIKRAIIEEFIDGEEISVEGVSHNGGHNIITFTDKVTSGFPHFVELEHHQPSKFINSDLKDKIEDIVIKGLNSLQIKNGASHSELIITKNDEIYLTEIGARMGGDFIGSDLVQLSTGFDYLKAVINIALNNFENYKIDVSKFSYAGVYFYSIKTPDIKYKYVNHVKDIVKYEFDDKLSNDLKQSADRSGYFIYNSNTKLLM